ncbi:TPA: hypothetical protein PXP51_000357 [Yersinia enterocolitica]|nr:hypothetical protein [Yersinia enterocolitica]
MKNILVLLSTLLFNCPATDAAVLPTDSGSFNFTVPQSTKKIEVFSYQLPEANARTPIVFVLTGLNRDADKYRDDWVENAPIAVSQQQLAHYFALPVLIAVGGKDNNPHHPLLRRSPQALAQGNSRLQRARAYFMAAEQQARDNKRPFNWQFTILSDVGHSGSKMSAYAAQQFGWFEQHGKFKVQDD